MAFLILSLILFICFIGHFLVSLIFFNADITVFYSALF